MNKDEEFIEKAIKIHGDKYDYSLVNYIKNDIDVIIICKTHGEFKQRPANHLSGANCLDCSIITRGKKRAKSKDNFINECNEKHNYKYDYSITEYTNCKSNIEIIYHKHGIFELIADNHKRKDGCKKCKKEELIERNKRLFIEKSNIVHNNKYDYSEIDYIKSTKKVNIICPLHGKFKQTPNSHSSGRGCDKCANELNIYKKEDYVKLSKTAILYLILLEHKDEKFYKIGKTINSIKRRFLNKSSVYTFTSINEHINKSGTVFDLEIELHRKYSSYSYKPNFVFSGHTECYNLDLPIEDIINKYPPIC